jgi:predicted nucleotidyltransferase
MINAADLALLGDFLHVLEAARRPCFLIGAGARILRMDMAFGLEGGRTTTDWDFAVELESWRGFRELRAALIAKGGFAPEGPEHGLRHRRGSRLDLVPYGNIATPDGELCWPSGNTMSVIGLAECAPRAGTIALSEGLSIHVASIPSIALLKLLAYVDRRNDAIVKDVQDFYWLAQRYADACDPLRPFDDLGDHLREDRLLTEDAGAWLLGVDVARQHEERSLRPLRGVLEEFGSTDSRVVADILSSLAAQHVTGKDSGLNVCRKLVAFRNGLLGQGG